MSAVQRNSTSVGIKRDDWLKAIDDARTAPLPPTDAITLAEFGEMTSTSRSGAGSQMRKLIAAGAAVTTKKQVRRADGGLIWVPAYVLKKPGAKKR